MTVKEFMAWVSANDVDLNTDITLCVAVIDLICEVSACVYDIDTKTIVLEPKAPE